MFPESRTSSDRPAPVAIIPVRPAATRATPRLPAGRPACCAAPSAVPRTFGRCTRPGRDHPVPAHVRPRSRHPPYTPSRRTFGVGHP